MIEHLIEQLSHLVHELRQDREQKVKEFEWIRASFGLATKQDLREMEKRIMKNQTELAADVRAATAQITKIGVETGTTLQKVKDLEALIASGAAQPELEAAVADLKTQAQATDDLVPDPVTPPPVA